MKNFFEEKLTHNNVNFCYTKKISIDEREMHPYHEMTYYIDGGATVLSDTFKEVLENEALLLIPKEHYHFFELKSPENFMRLKISFPDIPELGVLIDDAMPQIRIIKDIPPQLHGILRRMCENLSADRSDDASSLRCEVFCYGAFLMLLSEVSTHDSIFIRPQMRESGHFITRCIRYIDENLTGDVSALSIAEAMNVSESTLFRSFRKELGITLHRYITEKRLSYARKLIMDNENPTNIFLDCGYGDYSSFYRAYSKMFGHPPSEDRL